MKIKEMKINNKLIDEAKLNGQIVYRLDRDRTPPEIKDVSIKLNNKIKYPNKYLYPSEHIFPTGYRDLHYAQLGDIIAINISFTENIDLNTPPTFLLGGKKIQLNFSSFYFCEGLISIDEDMILQPNKKIELIIKNIVDLMGNKTDEIKSTGNNDNYVIFDSNNYIITYTDNNDIRSTIRLYDENSLKSFIQNTDMKTIEIISNGLKIQNCSYLFQQKSTLEKIDLSKFDTSNTINMSSMFNGCIKLKKLDLSNFNTQNVIYMDFMFYNCNNLAELDLSSFDFSQVSYLDNLDMFDNIPYDCLIYVKDETAKEFVLNVRSDLTNVQIKNI